MIPRAPGRGAATVIVADTSRGQASSGIDTYFRYSVPAGHLCQRDFTLALKNLPEVLQILLCHNFPRKMLFDASSTLIRVDLNYLIGNDDLLHLI